MRSALFVFTLVLAAVGCAPAGSAKSTPNPQQNQPQADSRETCVFL